MSEKNFDTQCTDDLVCPYCGYKDENSYEIASDLSNGDTKVLCPNCDKIFWAFAEMRVNYFTRKIDVRKDSDKMIDNCNSCSNFDLNLDEYSCYPFCKKSNQKANRTEIPNFCELEKWEDKE